MATNLNPSMKIDTLFIKKERKYVTRKDVAWIYEEEQNVS